MAPGPESKMRRRIVATTARLFRQQGCAATGLNQIVAESGAPKGSLYHYFPGGKIQLAAEALILAGSLVHATLEGLRCTEASAAAMAQAYGALLEGWMRESGFADGCPITTTLLETAPAVPELADIGQDVFASWQDVFATALREAGVARARAAQLGLAAIMMFEGALILARVRRDAGPIRAATAEIVALFKRAVAAYK